VGTDFSVSAFFLPDDHVKRGEKKRTLPFKKEQRLHAEHRFDKT